MGKKILTIRSWDLPAREKLFGKEPVFIFDPNDRSNEAIDNPASDPIGEAGKNAIPYWRDIFPKKLKDAFIRSFTDGIRFPEKRLLGSEWTQVLMESQNSIFQCSSCGKENFFDPSIGCRPCWDCKSNIKPSFFLDTQNSSVALFPGKQLLSYHFEAPAQITGSRTIGTIVPHPEKRNVWGLRNETENNWVARSVGKGMVEVPSGKSVPLVDGTKVTIGNYSCTIRS